jgi:hypothetical protein
MSVMTMPPATPPEYTLRLVIELAEAELPFASNLARLALEVRTRAERESILTALYRIASEHEAPYLAELVDSVLQHLERGRVFS